MNMKTNKRKAFIVLILLAAAITRRHIHLATKQAAGTVKGGSKTLYLG